MKHGFVTLHIENGKREYTAKMIGDDIWVYLNDNKWYLIKSEALIFTEL